MSFAALRDGRSVAALQGVDIGQVLVHGDDIAFSLVSLIPLEMIVESHRDHFIKADDETVVRRIVDAPMKALVEFGEIGESNLGLPKEPEMLALDARKLFPGRARGRRG
jgi:hypothetical protein